MENKEKTSNKYLEDLARYQYADVAVRLYSNKADAQFAPGALEKLVDGFAGIDKDALEGLKAGTFASKKGIETAIGIYAGKYQESLGKLDVSEFYDVRYNILKSLLGDKEANEAKSVFEKYKGQTVGSILEEVAKLQEIIKSKTKNFSKEQKEEAKKKFEKLVPIYSIINSLEQRNYDELKNGATKGSYKESITEALKKA